MNNLFVVATLTTALSVASASAQSIEDTLQDTTVSVTAMSGPLDFSIEGTRDGATELEVGISAFGHSFAGVDADLRFALGTDLDTADTLYARAEYNVATEVLGALTSYGVAAVQYDTNTELKDGTWTFDPTAGAVYGITDAVSVFAEVNYTWELNKASRDLGGSFEVGMPFAVTDQLQVTPSIARSFNTANEVTSAHLNLAFQF